MFIGHFAVALAAKPVVPSVSLGTLFIACELVDLAWPVFLLTGLERVEIRPGITAFTPLDFVHYPWTHSLAMVAAWSAGLALLYFLLRRNARAALALGAVVASHWLLDFLVHRPDLPLAPGTEERFGLGIWNSVPATLVLEGALFAAALLFYFSRTRALDRAGSWGLWGLLIFLLAAYAGAAFGPPPPGVAAIAWAGLIGGGATALLGYWVDRHRVTEA
ncbi:MAG: hypothetical protein ACREUN_09675 [Burkholderiales bacterium]